MTFLSKNYPEKIALTYQGASITYKALDNEIRKMAVILNELPEGILALTASYDKSFVIQLLAALHNKQPVAIFASNWSFDERKTKSDLLGNVITIDSLGVVVSYTESKQAIKPHPQTALILFTTGSTGHTKAVQLSMQNILANCHAVIKTLDFAAAQAQLLFLPLSYSFGLSGQLLPGLMTGLTTRLIENFTDIKALFETQDVPQMWSGVPSHWFAIAKIAANFPKAALKISHVISAGASLNTPLKEQLLATFPNAVVYNNYGLTEASPRVLSLSSRDPDFLHEFTGYPVGDWQLKLSAEKELLIAGSQVMLGYLGEESSQKINDGWLSTGDLADISPQGLVSIKGRCDHIVNIGGEKINLAEVELEIKKIEGLTEVAVIPVADALYGVRLIAFLEKTSEQCSAKVRDQFSARKIPGLVHVLSTLPRHKNGKLDRAALMPIATTLINKDTANAR
ncbi:MAG: class I adenylate-forming enzyme family protein [Legionella sp.]|nr:class I adenylate-forming enzyme family protein [Legionella sp.]